MNAKKKYFFYKSKSTEEVNLFIRELFSWFNFLARLLTPLLLFQDITDAALALESEQRTRFSSTWHLLRKR